ncbi:MAG: zinc-ribbon domain-containing protein [Clostridia bacterium]|nr:zinc-ribbon domain-containing protein [Clostridia bacterium]
MYCEKCGKVLEAGAKFCSNCGAMVEKKSEPFVPAFMKSYGLEEDKTEKPKRKTYERENFDWNLDGFPEPNKKTEDVDFNWSSVLEQNQKKIYGVDRNRERKPLFEPAEMSFDEDAYKALERAKASEIAPAPRTSKKNEDINSTGRYTIDQVASAMQSAEDKEAAQAEAEKQFEEMLKSVPELKESEYEIPENLFGNVNEETATPEAGEASDAEAADANTSQDEFVMPESLAAQAESLEKSQEQATEDSTKSLEEEIFGDMGRLSGMTYDSGVNKEHAQSDMAAATIVTGRSKKAAEAMNSETPSVVDTAGTDRVEKFYTFNQKKTELQALLDKEYARLEQMGHTAQPQAAAQAPAAVAAEQSQAAPQTMAAPQAAPTLTPQEPRAEKQEKKEPEYLGVLLATAPKGYYVERETARQVNSAEEGQKAEVLPSKSHQETEKKIPEHKLTFGDVFDDDDYGMDEDEESSRKGGCLKGFAIILCLIVLVQLAMIGVQYFAPDTQAAKTINKGYNYVIGKITGDKESHNPAEESSELEKVIKTHADENKNITQVVEDVSLAFENGKDYGFDNFQDAYKYKNEPWYTDDNDTEVTYLDGVVSTLIGYYSAWVDKMDDGDDKIYDYVETTSDAKNGLDELKPEDGVVYSIDTLSIGEIRFDGSGFYVLVKVGYVSSKDAEQHQEEQVVYMEPDNEMIKIMKIAAVK